MAKHMPQYQSFWPKNYKPSEEAKSVEQKKMERNDVCDECGKKEGDLGYFAAAYRKAQLKMGRPDPGNLCGECAGALTGKRIAEDILREEKR